MTTLYFATLTPGRPKGFKIKPNYPILPFTVSGFQDMMFVNCGQSHHAILLRQGVIFSGLVKCTCGDRLAFQKPSHIELNPKNIQKYSVQRRRYFVWDEPRINMDQLISHPRTRKKKISVARYSIRFRHPGRYNRDYIYDTIYGCTYGVRSTPPQVVYQLLKP